MFDDPFDLGVLDHGLSLKDAADEQSDNDHDDGNFDQGKTRFVFCRLKKGFHFAFSL